MQNKRGIFLGVFLVSLILAVSIIVLAKPGFIPAESKGGSIIIVPAHAIELAPGLFSLGTSTDVDGKVVQGFMFIHDNKRENAKPPWAGGGKNKGSSKCYSLFSKGAKWKTSEPYVTGTGVDLTLTETSLNTWDSEVSFNVFGTGSNGTTDGADDVSPDGKNEVEFQNLGTTSTIAYTILWGIFSGPPPERKLVEWDVVFNSDYTFGDANVSGNSVMDYQNIATHEFGHSLGLGHPENTCTEETMYAFAGFGETKKRNLEAGDIAGVNSLY